MADEMCPCGLVPLRYNSSIVEAQILELIEEHGEYKRITVPGEGTWLVAMHCIALHGIRAQDLPSSGYEKVS